MTFAETKQEPDVSWKIDRHIPLALICTVMAQGAMIVWWGSGVDSRLTQEVVRNDRQDRQIEAAADALSSQEVNAATTTAQLVAVRESLTEVKDALAEQNALLRQILTDGNKP